MYEQEVIDALKEACRREGTQSLLAERSGVTQGRISDYLNSRREISNMSVKTLFRLFPKLNMDFFGERGNQVTAKDIYGGVNQGGKTEGGIHVSNAGNQGCQLPELVMTQAYAEVMEKLMDSEELEDAVKVKIFKILKPKK